MRVPLPISILAFTFMVTFVYGARAQSASTSATVNSEPQKVVDEMWREQVSGKYLTSEGWKQSFRFYASQPARDPKFKIVIVYPDWSVWPAFVHGDHANVMIGLNIVGRLDSKMTFIPDKSEAVKQGVLYELIKQSVPDKEKQGHVIDEWKVLIDVPPREVYLDLDSAIHYVRQVRESSTDDVVKRNAQSSLGSLKRYKSKER